MFFSSLFIDRLTIWCHLAWVTDIVNKYIKKKKTTNRPAAAAFNSPVVCFTSFTEHGLSLSVSYVFHPCLQKNVKLYSNNIVTFTFMLPCIVTDFFLNNEQGALIIQIYSVIKLYMF